MSGALHDIRARYAAAPLFDDDLTRQLNDYERRTGSITHTLATGRSSPPGGAQQSVGPFRSVQQRASSVGTGSLSREHPNSVGGATVWKAQVAQLPPEIQRPAAVEWLLAYQGQAWASALNNSQQQDESKLNAWDVPQQDRRGASVKPERPRPTAAPPPVASPAPRAGSTRSTTPSGRRRRRDAPAPFEVKKRSTFAADDEDDSEGSERRLPPRGGQDTDESPPSRRSDDPRAAGRRGAAVSEPSRSGRAAANGYPTPNRQTGGRGDGDRPNGGGIGGGGDGRKTAWEGNDSDDTASRRLDPTATEDWAWRKLENVDENIARALARRGIQQAKLREIGAVPPGTKISGGVQTESTVTTTSAAIARADVSDLRLVDDAAAAYKARQEHHPSNRTPPQPLLLMPMKPIERAEDAIPAQAFADPQADRNKVRAGLFDRQNVSARYDINTKLDQMQLADEELIVSHVKDTAREHDDYRRILEHVAIGNRQGEQVPAPLGGYLSTRDPAYSSQQDSSDAVERWRNAKFNNVVASTGEMAAAVATTQALRKYGAENAQSTEKRASQPEVTFRRGAQQKAGYDARRKWSSVNFGLPTDGTNVDAAVATMDYEYRLAHAEAARQKLPQTGGGFVETNHLHPTATTDYGFLSSRTNETLDATHAQASSVYPVASGALRNRYDD